MKPQIVADVGNTRIKWGRCVAGAVTEISTLAPEDSAEWQRQLERWSIPANSQWVVASVHPQRCDRLVGWLRQHRHDVTEIYRASQLPLRVLLEQPDHAGIDRLLDAVAANSRRQAGTPAILIDAGSAVTVDYLDETGAFTGGAILPGARLMARALHDYTALLPEINPPRQPPPLPGKGTIPAMEVGVFWAVVGGVRALCEQYSAQVEPRPEIFLTGGDGPALYPVLGHGVQLWSAMTLDGIRLAAEALP